MGTALKNDLFSLWWYYISTHYPMINPLQKEIAEALIKINDEEPFDLWEPNDNSIALIAIEISNERSRRLLENEKIANVNGTLKN